MGKGGTGSTGWGEVAMDRHRHGAGVELEDGARDWRGRLQRRAQVGEGRERGFPTTAGAWGQAQAQRSRGAQGEGAGREGTDTCRGRQKGNKKGGQGSKGWGLAASPATATGKMNLRWKNYKQIFNFPCMQYNYGGKSS